MLMESSIARPQQQAASALGKHGPDSGMPPAWDLPPLTLERRLSALLKKQFIITSRILLGRTKISPVSTDTVATEPSL
jgi:hypothetical protein